MARRTTHEGTAALTEAGTPEARPAPVQHPLTLVMPIASPEAYEGLRQVLSGLQGRPDNPITAALDKIGTVHFARFVFLEDNTRLAVITTYDGDFERYVMDFVDEIGDVFNTLLKFVANPPPLPVQSDPQAFLQFVLEHDLGAVGELYSAYPRATVLDILDALEPDPA